MMERNKYRNTSKRHTYFKVLSFGLLLAAAVVSPPVETGAGKAHEAKPADGQAKRDSNAKTHDPNAQKAGTGNPLGPRAHEPGRSSSPREQDRSESPTLFKRMTPEPKHADPAQNRPLQLGEQSGEFPIVQTRTTQRQQAAPLIIEATDDQIRTKNYEKYKILIQEDLKEKKQGQTMQRVYPHADLVLEGYISPYKPEVNPVDRPSRHQYFKELMVKISEMPADSSLLFWMDSLNMFIRTLGQIQMQELHDDILENEKEGPAAINVYELKAQLERMDNDIDAPADSTKHGQVSANQFSFKKLLQKKVSLDVVVRGYQLSESNRVQNQMMQKSLGYLSSPSEMLKDRLKNLFGVDYHQWVLKTRLLALNQYEIQIYQQARQKLLYISQNSQKLTKKQLFKKYRQLYDKINGLSEQAYDLLSLDPQIDWEETMNSLYNTVEKLIVRKLFLGSPDERIQVMKQLRQLYINRVHGMQLEESQVKEMTINALELEINYLENLPLMFSSKWNQGLSLREARRQRGVFVQKLREHFLQPIQQLDSNSIKFFDFLETIEMFGRRPLPALRRPTVQIQGQITQKYLEQLFEKQATIADFLQVTTNLVVYFNNLQNNPQKQTARLILLKLFTECETYLLDRFEKATKISVNTLLQTLLSSEEKIKLTEEQQKAIDTTRQICQFEVNLRYSFPSTNKNQAYAAHYSEYYEGEKAQVQRILTNAFDISFQGQSPFAKIKQMFNTNNFKKTISFIQKLNSISDWSKITQKKVDQLLKGFLSLTPPMLEILQYYGAEMNKLDTHLDEIPQKVSQLHGDVLQIYKLHKPLTILNMISVEKLINKINQLNLDESPYNGLLDKDQILNNLKQLLQNSLDRQIMSQEEQTQAKIRDYVVSYMKEILENPGSSQNYLDQCSSQIYKLSLKAVNYRDLEVSGSQLLNYIVQSKISEQEVIKNLQLSNRQKALMSVQIQMTTLIRLYDKSFNDKVVTDDVVKSKLKKIHEQQKKEKKVDQRFEDEKEIMEMKKELKQKEPPTKEEITAMRTNKLREYSSLAFQLGEAILMSPLKNQILAGLDLTEQSLQKLLLQMIQNKPITQYVPRLLDLTQMTVNAAILSQIRVTKEKIAQVWKFVISSATKMPKNKFEKEITVRNCQNVANGLGLNWRSLLATSQPYIMPESKSFKIIVKQGEQFNWHQVKSFPVPPSQKILHLFECENPKQWLEILKSVEVTNPSNIDSTISHSVYQEIKQIAQCVQDHRSLVSARLLIAQKVYYHLLPKMNAEQSIEFSEEMFMRLQNTQRVLIQAASRVNIQDEQTRGYYHKQQQINEAYVWPEVPDGFDPSNPKSKILYWKNPIQKWKLYQDQLKFKKQFDQLCQNVRKDKSLKPVQIKRAYRQTAILFNQEQETLGIFGLLQRKPVKPKGYAQKLKAKFNIKVSRREISKNEEGKEKVQQITESIKLVSRQMFVQQDQNQQQAIKKYTADVIPSKPKSGNFERKNLKLGDLKTEPTKQQMAAYRSWERVKKKMKNQSKGNQQRKSKTFD